MYKDKKKQIYWEKLKKKADSTTDGLGLGIDSGIKDTVIALWANGFETGMSCEGHKNRALPYPWVEISTKTNLNKKPKSLHDLFDILDEYNELRMVNRKSRFDAQIIITNNRLQPRGGENIGSLPSEILTKKIRKKLLIIYRKEFSILTNLLKEIYFKRYQIQRTSIFKKAKAGKLKPRKSRTDIIEPSLF